MKKRMKLRGKLLLTILLASFLIILLLVIVPYYLVKKTVFESSKKIEYQLNEQKKANILSNINLFYAEFGIKQEILKALLFEINRKHLKMSETEKLDFATSILIQYPAVSMVQLFSDKAVVAITYPDSYLHEGILSATNDQLTLFAPDFKQNFLAVPLKQTPASEHFYELFEYGNKENIPSIKEDQPHQFTQRDLSIKNELIKKLTSLQVHALNEGVSPEGLLYSKDKSRGQFILTKEIYSFSPIVPTDSVKQTSPIEEIIKNKEELYLVYSLAIDHTIISLGSSLLPLIRNLAAATHSTILLKITDLWIGYDPEGNILDPAYIQAIKTHLSDKNEGYFEWNNEKYHYFQIQQDKMSVVMLPTKDNTRVLQILAELDNSLSRKLLAEMIVVSALILIILLLFFWHFSHSFVRPIQELARATSLFAKGNLREGALPQISKRNDEVAELAAGFKEMVLQLKEREKVRAVLNKVVSKDIAEEILKGQVQLGGEDRIVTMLFCDVRDFTSQTANLPPQATIQLLNFYMTRMSEIIEGEGGLIDKYIGDEIMALYGAPVASENHAMKAIASGMLIIKTLEHLKELREGKIALEVGIGIHTGLVVAGNMGAENRLNYTVLGSNVNLAARLCQVSKANQLLISEHTLEEPEVKDSFEVKAMEPIKLKGFQDPVKVYEVIGFAWNQ